MRRHRLNKLQSYSLPSNTHKNITLGVSGATYTAPADGWYILRYDSTNSGYVRMTNQTTAYEDISGGTSINLLQVPVKKGDIIKIDYTTNVFGSFIFFYTIGSEDEAPQT